MWKFKFRRSKRKENVKEMNEKELKIEKHTVSNRWALLSNVFIMSFSSGKYGTNNAKTKQH